PGRTDAARPRRSSSATPPRGPACRRTRGRGSCARWPRRWRPIAGWCRRRPRRSRGWRSPRGPRGSRWRARRPRAGGSKRRRRATSSIRARSTTGSRRSGTSTYARRPHVRHLVIEARYRETADLAPGDPGYALLDPDPLRFRDRAVLDFAHFDARTLRRTSGGRTLELASADGESWRAVAPAGAVVEGTNVARVVGTLGNLHAESFLTKPPGGTPDLTLEVAVQPPGEAQPARHTIELAKTKEAPGCAGRLDRQTWFLFAQAACDELRLPLTK